jgi:DNA repair exonuclease SbcCD ATPase subunit
MELCSNNHEEVCFSGCSCPVCQLLDDHANEIAELKEKIETFERQIEEQQAVAQAYKEKWQASDAEVTRLCRGQLDGER